MEGSNSELLEWLLTGDPSICYQTKRDLLENQEFDLKDLQSKIAMQGWGKWLLDLRDNVTGIWGNGIYSPKWISTHYTMLQLKNMGIPSTNPYYIDSSKLLLDRMWFNNGEVAKKRLQDLCITAMLISICCYGGGQSEKINQIIDYILDKQYSDGGWNCKWDHGDLHSSVHTTLTVLEAFRDYELAGYTYRLEEIKNSLPKAWDFLLRKHLFRSERTGEIIHNTLLMLSYPCRWKYDILRCLEYFQSVGKIYDPRMEEALSIIINKKTKDNRWPVQHKHTGLVHFDMEKTGHASRWNTLRVLRILKMYRLEEYQKSLG
jgi:hypothetical protein